jgi:hypothetical protein
VKVREIFGKEEKHHAPLKKPLQTHEAIIPSNT